MHRAYGTSGIHPDHIVSNDGCIALPTSLPIPSTAFTSQSICCCFVSTHGINKVAHLQRSVPKNNGSNENE